MGDPTELQQRFLELEETAREYKRMSARYRRASKELHQVAGQVVTPDELREKLTELRERFSKVGIRLE
jgi:exonuclease VII small subunit